MTLATFEKPYKPLKNERQYARCNSIGLAHKATKHAINMEDIPLTNCETTL